MYCGVCGIVDEHYDEHAMVFHENTPKHICNTILANYKINKRLYCSNRDGVLIFCNAECLPFKDVIGTKIEDTDRSKIRVYAKPKQKVKFSFTITNDMKNEDLMIVGVQLAHPQPQFIISNHKYMFGDDPHLLKKKSSIKKEVFVKFQAADIGQYEMPIMFTLFRPSDEKNLIYIREMVVMVEEYSVIHVPTRSPYTNEDWEKADNFIVSTNHVPYQNTFKIPPLFKILLPRGLEDKALEGLRVSPEVMDQLRLILVSTRDMFDEGITNINYMTYFHHLLWWEEIIARINLRKYNMAKVMLQRDNELYLLEVPGLAENRPSLLRGDRVFIRPHMNTTVIFESIIKDMEENIIRLGSIDPRFHRYYSPSAVFDIRFLVSRIPMERAHDAVSRIASTEQECRVFPVYRKKIINVLPIKKFYNPLISVNKEQRSAVEHIVARTSGKAPYMVFGPPGTGKTMTIVEAIIQIVLKSPKNRVMVCTDSNMAADHIALMLLKFNRVLNISNFIIRANSQNRVWSVMPQELEPISNGKSYETFYSVSNSLMASYRIVVTTLLHAAKYGSVRSQTACKLQMTHLFIDEAGQASEPNALVPITGLLSKKGQLVLAGDPQQLGPVCISREAKDRGLGKSLMERLKQTHENLYDSDPNYITMLINNFRSHPDILEIPNELFYNKNLKPLAPLDPLSNVSILDLPGGNSAVAFHAVNSKEQKMGKSPSYFNEIELDMMKRYVTVLIDKHSVLPKDIGIIAPYIRQVYKMKTWLSSSSYDEVEVGTVEAFQGKEKRVIIVSTVRANCKLLDYDAKYNLGFLVDDKRFNVTLTRAKAKLIIIGNPACLVRDIKWRRYMEFCKEKGSYFGMETEQLERSEALLIEVVRTRFDKCRLTEALKPKEENNKKKKKK